MAARFADGGAQLFLRQAKFLYEPPEALSFLDRIQILALQVLHEGSRHGVGIGELAHQDRHLMQPSLLGRSPAALARDNLEMFCSGRVWTCQQRLQDATCPDRRHEFRKRLRIEAGARLEWAGFQPAAETRRAGHCTPACSRASSSAASFV